MTRHATPGNADASSNDLLKRQTILKHARAAFVSQGYAAAKIEPISRDAGVSTATLYSLFDGKAGLFAAVIDDAADEFAERVRGFEDGDGDARTQLQRFARAYSAFMGDPFVRAIFRLVISERRRFCEVSDRFVDRGRSDFGAVLMRVLQGLIQSGELKAIEKPSWAAGQLMGMLEHPVFFVPLVAGDEVELKRTPSSIIDDAVETFLARYGA